MSYVNYQFLEEFKRLDKLCHEMYGESGTGKLGVTLYLEDMVAQNYSGVRSVEDWSEDLYRLKQLRDIRNRIVHDVGVEENCRQSDVDFIVSFRQRIINGDDPLTLLRKKQKAAHRAAASARDMGADQTTRSADNSKSSGNPKRNELYDERSLSVGFVAVVIVSVIVILGILLLSRAG